MKTILVTGPIGSGKSAVCRLLASRGVPVYDCDARTKSLYVRRKDLVPRLEAALGTELRCADGSLDKARLAALIFHDDAARETLESLVYPELLKDFRRWRSRRRQKPFVVMESAILLSKPLFQGLPDAVVLVDAPEEIRLRRAMERDGVPEEAVRRRMAAQPLRRDLAQVVIDNSGTPEELAAAVEQVFFDKNAYICKLLTE